MHMDPIGDKVHMVPPSLSWCGIIAMQLRMAYAGVLPGCSVLGAFSGIVYIAGAVEWD